MTRTRFLIFNAIPIYFDDIHGYTDVSMYIYLCMLDKIKIALSQTIKDSCVKLHEMP